MNRTLALSGLFLALGSVSACGLTGDLQRPKPIFGGPTDVEAAELPADREPDLPPLPERSSEDSGSAPDADDELLGGPGGF